MGVGLTRGVGLGSCWKARMGLELLVRLMLVGKRGEESEGGDQRAWSSLCWGDEADSDWGGGPADGEPDRWLDRPRRPRPPTPTCFIREDGKSFSREITPSLIGCVSCRSSCNGFSCPKGLPLLRASEGGSEHDSIL